MNQLYTPAHQDRRQPHSLNYTELVIRAMARLSKQGDEEGYERARQAMVRHHQVIGGRE